MSVPDRTELDRLFMLWKNRLWTAFGVSENEAASEPKLYRFRVTGIGRLDENSLEIHIEFAPNAVYGIEHVPASKAGIVIALYSHGEVNAPPGMEHLLTEFITSGGIHPANLVGTDADGNPRVFWDTAG
ncbi:hypothetical protein [Rhodococcus opacus]|uniref:hypothetical protein n=1 Tax=Rhodococcus opacus TaxID=37919 RepID=UPI0006BB4B9A|nr:hypothetical protein [Rhodococcus opacus]